MAEASRPLSPHLQVYRWQVSNTTSILHRLTGFVLAAGAWVLVGWLLALAAGQGPYLQFTAMFTGLLGQLALIAWTFCLFYHLCNGIRHLAFDADIGFDRRTASRTGLVAGGAAVLLTLGFWAVVLSRGF